MERRPVHDGPEVHRRPALTWPFVHWIVSVQQGSPRTVTSLVTSITTSPSGSNTVSLPEASLPVGAHTRIMSPLLYGPGGSRSVLSWAPEPARRPLNPAELQPRAWSYWTCRASHSGTHPAVPAGWPAGRGAGAMREPDANSSRSPIPEQCTQAAACCTSAAHPGTRLDNRATVRAPAGARDVAAGLARKPGGRPVAAPRTGSARSDTWLVAGPLRRAGEATGDLLGAKTRPVM